jgi:hypothetical protein
MSNVHPELLSLVRAQLQEGERLAWAMSPEPIAALEPSERGKSKSKWEGITILGGGYATLGAGAMALRSGSFRWLLVPLALFVIGGVALALTFWRKLRKRRTLEATVYVVTTRRALVVQAYPDLSVQAHPLDTFSDVTLVNEDGDFASLAFVSKSGAPGIVFIGIPEPQRARKQILRVLQDPGATDREIAASEAYLTAMRQLTRSVR